MASIANTTAETLRRLLRAENGLAQSVSRLSVEKNLSITPIESAQIVNCGGVGSGPDQGRRIRYPVFAVYCDRVSNLQREKFCRFSGTARLNVEVTVSGERSEGMEGLLQTLASAVTEVLERSWGDWGQGIRYGGGYDIQFGTVKKGGRNYIQTAKLVLEVDVTQTAGQAGRN